MIKKEIGIGFLIGILANLLGMLCYILLFSDFTIFETLEEAVKNEVLGSIIAAGAILNFLPFFLFLKKGRPYRARGVLMASILAALAIAIIKVL